MQRLLAGAALALSAALIPLSATADEAPTTALVYAVPVVVTFPHFEVERPAARPRLPARAIVYVLQAFDAAQTSAALRRSGRYEQNRMMRPFAHGGTLTLALGFALGDVARDRLLAHAPERLRDAANGAQALANIDGILNTRRALRAP